jgi:hypothetical protein
VTSALDWLFPLLINSLSAGKTGKPSEPRSSRQRDGEPEEAADRAGDSLFCSSLNNDANWLMRLQLHQLVSSTVIDILALLAAV